MEARKRAMRFEDFEEEEVWSFVNERDEDLTTQMSSYKSKDHYFGSGFDSGSGSGSGSGSAWCISSAPRMIPRGNNNNPTNTHEGKVVQQSSAPVNIPDWSKIYGKSSEDIMGSRKLGHHHGYGSRNDVYGHANDGDDDEYGHDNDDDVMVPPHEYIAKKLARSKISSFSVCEGVGRTLKGRDLSKVRNAILSKTGFLE